MATKRKRTVARKVSPKKSSKGQGESFKLIKEKYPFMSFRITDQTVYWSILLIMILVLYLWVLNIQVNISDMLSSVV
jgi:hypothetical protein